MHQKCNFRNKMAPTHCIDIFDYSSEHNSGKRVLIRAGFENLAESGNFVLNELVYLQMFILHITVEEITSIQLYISSSELSNEIIC